MSAIEQAVPTKYPDVRNYIGGEFVDGNGARTLDVTDPSDGSVISRVPLSGAVEIPDSPILHSQVKQLDSLNLDRFWLAYCEPGARVTLGGVRLPARQRAVAALTIHPAEPDPGAVLHVVQRAETGVIGGSTFRLRAR